MKIVYIAILFLFLGLSSNGIAQNGGLLVPRISELRGLIGGPADDKRFYDFVKKYNLHVYKKEDVWNEILWNRNQANRTLRYWYAGLGYILAVSKSGKINVKDETWCDERSARVDSVELVFGLCEEQRRFGKWFGEPPSVYIPKNPSDLMSTLKRVDYDTSVWYLMHDNVDRKVRIMQEVIDFDCEVYQYMFINEVFVKLKIPRIISRP